MDIGKRIHKLRTALNLTQIEFANRLKISKGFLSNLEKGIRKPSDQLIKLISYEFSSSENWLITGRGDMFISPEESLKNQIARYGEKVIRLALQNLTSGSADLDEPELEPKLNRLINIARKLTPRQQELLLEITEEWSRLNKYAQAPAEATNRIPVPAGEYYRDLALLKDLKEKTNDVNYLCQLIKSGLIVLTDQGRPLTPEQIDDFTKYLKETPHPELFGDDFNINLDKSPLAAHLEGEPGLNPELQILMSISLKLNRILEQHLDNRFRKKR